MYPLVTAITTDSIVIFCNSFNKRHMEILDLCYIIIRYPIRLPLCFEVFEAVVYGNLYIKCLFLKEKCNFYSKSTVQYESVSKILN